MLDRMTGKGDGINDQIMKMSMYYVLFIIVIHMEIISIYQVCKNYRDYEENNIDIYLTQYNYSIDIHQNIFKLYYYFLLI